MVGHGRGGFTLLEAIVSLLISSALVALVSTVFMVQTDFYGTQLQRTAALDNARSVTELVSSELRTMMAGGFVVANDTQLVIRSPIVLGVVCANSGSFTHLYYSGGPAEMDTTELAGIAVYNPATETWGYNPATWGELDEKEQLADQQCAMQGSDTLGAGSHFGSLKKLKHVTPSLPPVGSVLMFYRESEFVLTESTLEPGSIGLYRGPYGGTPVEFASGMDPGAQFMYRTFGSSYVSAVSAYALSTITAVRLVATTRIRAQSGGKADVTAGWSVNVPLRNAY